MGGQQQLLPPRYYPPRPLAVQPHLLPHRGRRVPHRDRRDVGRWMSSLVTKQWTNGVKRIAWVAFALHLIVNASISNFVVKVLKWVPGREMKITCFALLYAFMWLLYIHLWHTVYMYRLADLTTALYISSLSYIIIHNKDEKNTLLSLVIFISRAGHYGTFLQILLQRPYH